MIELLRRAAKVMVSELEGNGQAYCLGCGRFLRPDRGHVEGCPAKETLDFLAAHDAMEADEVVFEEPETLPEPETSLPYGEIAMHFWGWLGGVRDYIIVDGDGETVLIAAVIEDYMAATGDTNKKEYVPLNGLYSAAYLCGREGLPIDRSRRAD